MCWEQIGLHRALAGKGDDWLLLPKGFSSFVTPCPTRLAVYIHDVMAVTFADRYPGSMSRVKQAYFAACYRASLARARVVFTNTEFSRRELESWAARHGLRCPPVVVVGYGVDRPPPAGGVAEGEDRVLVFVRRSPHKRTDLAFKYVEQWRKQYGYRGRLTAIGTLPAGLRLPGDGTWTHEDRLSPAAYAGLMGRSRVAVHFSEYEGFGMPPLEAVLAGACPVYSDLPPEREVMNGAGWPFETQSYDSFAAAMNQAMATSPDQVRVWKDRLMARHDWPTVAGRVVSALREFA